MIFKVLLSFGVLLLACPLNAIEFVEDPATTGVVTVRDGMTNVLSYNFGDQLMAGVDPKYTRSSYIHPLYSLDGEPLTDDFPADHHHHHGIFWAWPVVKARGEKTQNWHPHVPSLRHHMVRWTKETSGTATAILAIENRWLLNEKEEVAQEKVTLLIHPKENDSRAIDVVIKLEAVGGPLTLEGTSEGNKGYGGFCFRGAPDFKGAKILTDTGTQEKDVVDESQKWVDLSTDKHGMAIFSSPDHPDYPPKWMARNSYAGFMNVSWPGLSTRVLEPGKPVTLRYRLYVHSGPAEPAALQQAYENYAAMQ